MIATKIVPFGNSLGIRLPKSFLESIGANAKNTAVSVDLINDSIIIRKQPEEVPYRSFEQLMEDFYRQPFDEIDVYMESPEADWGSPKGDELW